MNKKEVLEAFKGPKTKPEVIEYIYARCANVKQRMLTSEMQKNLEAMGFPVDLTTINRVLKRMEKMGVKIGKNPHKPKFANSAYREQECRKFAGITWGEFNCLPNGELI